MKLPNTRNYSPLKQHSICIAFILLVSAACYLSADIIGHRVVALMLLMAVSVVAMLFDIFPVLLAAILSALIWNFFFIRPLYTFHIDQAEDILMFLMYFLIALVNTVLTYNIRAAEKKARDKEEKENTIKLYNTLLNSLSHELRTPIATIIGAVDTLHENAEKLTPANQAELLNQIDIAGNRLNGQVENLLNMSRLESGMLKLNLDWCDVNELIFSVIQKLARLQHSQKIVFVPDERLPLFKIDAGLIEQVLHNILFNALQYTPSDATITVEVSLQNTQCIITLTDTGNGFPDDTISVVFDKFYRLPSTQTGGSGLGLSIAKGFMEAHSGTIELRNMPSGGASFTLILPAEQSFLNKLKHE